MPIEDPQGQDARHRPRKHDILILVLIGVLGLITLIANPGYFSHDEWQKFDHYINHGFKSYALAYGQISVGSGFGTPVRPLAFLVQGVHSLVFQSHPFLVHLISVANTLAVAIALYAGCMRFGLSRRSAMLSAALFMLNPMTTLATGWSAALMDQMYVSFGLLTLYLADRYVRDEQASPLSLLPIAISGMAAVLSKETGIIFPATLLLPMALTPQLVLPRWRRLLVAGAAWSLPILGYLLFRATAIQSSFHAGQSDPYAASLRYIADNLFVYWQYPFHPLIGEAIAWQSKPLWSLWLAFGAHCLLVAMVAVVFRWRAALLYLFFYLIFLLPVLFIPQKGSHYLFASAIPLSIALACLATHSKTAVKALGIALAVVLVYHGLRFQGEIYKVGRCMDRIAITLEANHVAAGASKDVYFSTEEFAPKHLLLRLITGRDQVGGHKGVNLHANEVDQAAPQGALALKLNKQCLLTPVPAQ
ncbi:MAG: hypothetical protein I8H76_02935 [Burkholderiales bacterium]|nr:hypothetical protein [Burkholderiales bacterium]MBH2015122.1 hypothetical protein [Burkholderiales bacterium]